MVFWLCCLIGILTLIILILIIKICLLKKSADEIADAFADRVRSDTNTLIDISSRDRHMRKLADSINRELLLLQDDRRRCQPLSEDYPGTHRKYAPAHGRTVPLFGIYYCIKRNP